MSVKRFSVLVLTGTLVSGCSSLNQQDNYWASPSQWFQKSGESDARNPLDSDQLTVATGDDGLKQAVEGGSEEDAQRALDDAIAPELRAAAQDAREALDNPSQQASAVPEETPDLWHRLRNGFALDHSVDNKRVRDQLNWYAKHPKYINRVVDRGSRYLHHILSETEKRGLPSEFALLPVVESAFDPFAYSHGRAAGLWQFIPSTGKYFGLTQSWWHDDRRDVISATDAALTYLERLANRFDGDYTLALAAYNSGGGTVSSAMRRNRKANRPQDFWSLRLPQETRHYVPKLIALAKIFDDPQAYGITLPTLDDEPYFEVVKTGSQLDLAQAAKLAGVDIDEIYLLNPSYNRWATNPDGPHRLLVPRQNAEQFRHALAEIPPSKRVSWRNYKVRSGDSLIRIANRFSTTPSVIRQVNKLNGDMIRIGQRLMIPSASKGSDAYALSASQRLERKQQRKRDGNKVRYTVRRGDTFWDIAREHRVTVREVAGWNSMAPGDPLIPGKELVIWSKTTQPTIMASNSTRGKAMVRKVGYRVRKGDSLSTIASRFSVNVRDIASWNDLNTSRYLQPGQSLVLYVDIRNSP
ncbi:Membrane-bound lytic murein transglycosylase D precursor [Marinobacter nitratireducens]|uniref:Membrane-bound lytic murein transglycosylase D n=1 Tax=Marinobacter nitratireducens TaxID=1137280 RepID=A0A072N488_9GAMM|nr:LysM peptidoglycan-binding domain-containing protein [Marinobacter nitratireducens]KEF32331.1 Membrane-bound lytic murein transglycosylase D precursor [Marinobacter nitratireducens]